VLGELEPPYPCSENGAPTISCMDEEEKKKMKMRRKRSAPPLPPQIGDPGSATGCRALELNL